MERLCMDCGQVLVGRADKKFCDDGCRSNYNNQLNMGGTAHIRQTNAILKRNRKILETLNPAGKVKISKEALIKAGFNFEYMTSIYETGKGAQYRFCYEYGYLLLEHEEVLLVKR